MHSRAKCRRKAPGPLDLLLMLADSCMHRLSPNAWKVVSYVASQHIRVHPEWLSRIHDPLGFAFQRDMDKLGMFDAPWKTSERPYRTIQGGPAVPGEMVARFARISLEELCKGVRIKRLWRDHGTGLSKSSVAEAINEALLVGVLVRERMKSASGRDVSSGYAIDWDKVQELDWKRRKGLR